MTDYLLFIDTETSGLPKDWGKAYSAKDNWPFCVQIAWSVYSKDGKNLKQENHYIKDDDFTISASSIKIHGITHSFLESNGESRSQVLKILFDDVIKYEPLVVGHFMEFDYKMLGADFYRIGIENPIKREMTFCTMVATTYMVKNPSLKFLRLGQLYEELFHTKLYNEHNASVDASATADCFFELVRRGKVDDDTIEQQQKKVTEADLKEKTEGCVLPVLLIILLTFLILYML